MKEQNGLEEKREGKSVI